MTMILYKYVPFAVGESILENNVVLFSQPKYFNDPFDLPTYPAEPASDPVSSIFSHLRVTGKNLIWGEKTGILSLTRTPVNALMWAHYADKHQGMVVGIDMETAGFTDEKRNFIPAQYGSIVYVSRRNTSPFAGRPRTAIAVGETHHFPADHFEKLQRVFLQKPLYWSYEEEVRVLKCLHGITGDDVGTVSGRFRIIRDKERDLHLYVLPAGSIRELYFGIRADHERVNTLALSACKANPQLAVFGCAPDSSSLTVNFKEYGAALRVSEGSGEGIRASLDERSSGSAKSADAGSRR